MSNNAYCNELFLTSTDIDICSHNLKIHKPSNMITTALSLLFLGSFATLGSAANGPYLRKLEEELRCESTEDCTSDKYCARGKCIEHGLCRKTKDCFVEDNLCFVPGCTGVSKCSQGVCTKYCHEGEFVFLPYDSVDSVPGTPPEPTPVEATPEPAPPTLAPITPTSTDDEQSGGGYGDPHLKTWTGRVYDFHGECDLVLAKSTVFGDGLGLETHIRTTIRDDWAFISSVAVKIGKDVLEVQSGGLYLINGIEDANLKSTKVANFEVRKHGGKKPDGTVKARFRVDMKEHGMLEIKVYNEFVSVMIRAARAKDFHDSVGLMGSFEHGMLVGRDMLTVFQDVDGFGQEWQVRDTDSVLFHNSRFPQFPAKCTMPATPSSEHRRLSEVAGGAGMIPQAVAEKACEHLPVEDRDACVYDVLTTGDLAMAELDDFDDYE